MAGGVAVPGDGIATAAVWTRPQMATIEALLPSSSSNNNREGVDGVMHWVVTPVSNYDGHDMTWHGTSSDHQAGSISASTDQPVSDQPINQPTNRLRWERMNIVYCSLIVNNNTQRVSTISNFQCSDKGKRTRKSTSKYNIFCRVVRLEYNIYFRSCSNELSWYHVIVMAAVI